MPRTIEEILEDMLGTMLDVRNQLDKHHAQDVEIYERNLAVSERCCDYSGRQTLVAEYMLNDRLASRTPPTEG